MGVSTDGQISFGILLDEGVETPWDDEKYAFDIEKWWVDKFPQEKLPVTLVNCCSSDYPIWIVSVPSSVMRCRRGYPVDFDHERLLVTTKDVSQLQDFCEIYLNTDKKPKWYLSSYWG